MYLRDMIMVYGVEKPRETQGRPSNSRIFQCPALKSYNPCSSMICRPLVTLACRRGREVQLFLKHPSQRVKGSGGFYAGFAGHVNQLSDQSEFGSPPTLSHDTTHRMFITATRPFCPVAMIRNHWNTRPRGP